MEKCTVSFLKAMSFLPDYSKVFSVHYSVVNNKADCTYLCMIMYYILWYNTIVL